MRALAIFLGLVAMSSGCATVTGIPAHGGGKRFFIEQELISASARASAQCVHLEQISGKRAALFLTTVGDQGAGNLVGGRYQWQSAIRGDYVSNPNVATRNSAGLPQSVTVTRDGAGAVQQIIESTNPTIFPSASDSQQEGWDARTGAGVGFNGMGDYSTLGFLNDDASFLGAVIREALVLKGVILSQPDQAEVFIYVTVDAFGTNRNRTEWHLYNEERLQAKTAVHVTVFDNKGKVLIPTQTSSWEADYRERYMLWCGPWKVHKRVYCSDDLLVSYRNLAEEAVARQMYEEEEAKRKEAEEKAAEDETKQEPVDSPKPERLPPLDLGGVTPGYRSTPPERKDEDSTRPNDLIRRLTRPDPSRPEDVQRYGGEVPPTARPW